MKKKMTSKHLWYITWETLTQVTLSSRQNGESLTPMSRSFVRFLHPIMNHYGCLNIASNQFRTVSKSLLLSNIGPSMFLILSPSIILRNQRCPYNPKSRGWGSRKSHYRRLHPWSRACHARMSLSQYDSEVVYHNLREELQNLGVIFEDMSVHYYRAWATGQVPLVWVVPNGDHMFAALHGAVWSEELFSISISQRVKISRIRSPAYIA